MLRVEWKIIHGWYINWYVLLILVLVGLYEEPERPPNAVDYIKRYMGAPTGVDVEALRTENEQLKLEKVQLENTIKDLNSKVVNIIFRTRVTRLF